MLSEFQRVVERRLCTRFHLSKKVHLTRLDATLQCHVASPLAQGVRVAFLSPNVCMTPLSDYSKLVFAVNI